MHVHYRHINISNLKMIHVKLFIQYMPCYNLGTNPRSLHIHIPLLYGKFHMTTGYGTIFDNCFGHYSDGIMGTMASQITSLTTVHSTISSGPDQRKHQSSVSLAFVRGIHRIADAMWWWVCVCVGGWCGGGGGGDGGGWWWWWWVVGGYYNIITWQLQGISASVGVASSQVYLEWSSLSKPTQKCSFAVYFDSLWNISPYSIQCL